MSAQSQSQQYVLGLDIGAESIGWAIINTDDDSPKSIQRLGVHCFEAGVEGDIQSGRDQSRAAARREARQPRRQHWRRQWRRKRLLRILQSHGLLPQGDISSPEAIHEYLLSLDALIRNRRVDPSDRVENHTLHYGLRAAALDEPLQPHEFGRALYHLAQRRGFLSNRKVDRADERVGDVKKGITELSKQMQSRGARTLGEFFAQVDPEEERIRRRWTSRQMYLDEFDALWNAQACHHSAILTDSLRAIIHRAIFYQRPLKSQKQLIGHCDLYPQRKRMAIGRNLAQEFRLLQGVNNLRVCSEDGSSRELTAEERTRVIGWLTERGDVTFAQLKQKKFLGLPKSARFNLEEGGEKRLCGHRTNAKLAPVFGDRWWTMSDDERDAVVDDVMSIQRPATLRKRGAQHWGLTLEQAEALAELTLEDARASHCRAAVERLIPHLRAGRTYGEARRLEFPERFAAREPLAQLPPVCNALPDLRNPAVCRALTELRKLVNAIVRKLGKPARVRIELARELKKNRKRREEAAKRNQQNRRRREDAKRRILSELGLASPSRTDVDKVLLAEECNWRCPYTDQPIGMKTLLGDSPQFDIEHIWPLGRSFDDSYFNKTLCYHEENRARKRNHTPFEAYSQNPEQWDAILGRVRQFQGEAAREKLRRFVAEDLPSDFTHRQLNDTKYASRCAGDYLALLFGGRSDAGGKQRIQVSAGGVTSFLRGVWQLNGILNDGDVKTRDDHRHHAVDAVAVAFAGPATVKLLADAAENAQKYGRRRFAPVSLPWPDFTEHLRTHVDRINISHRPHRRLAGPLHAETLYSKPIPSPDGDVRHIRKELHKLTATELKKDRIVDPIVRKLVRERHAELGGGLPNKVFADPAEHPVMQTRAGRFVAIHKVRVRATVKPWAVGAGARQRFVAPKAGSNHHTVISAKLSEDGGELSWEDTPVSRFDANARRAAGTPVIEREHCGNRCFKFSLVPGDYVEMENKDGKRELYRVASISKGDIEFRHQHDARDVQALKAAKARVRGGGPFLFKRKARKVTITYLGQVLPAND